MSTADLLTALIGLLAIGLTTYTIVQTRAQRRLDAFTRMHELLITEEQQRGRRMVHAAAKSGVWPERNSPEWDEMNRALAMLDVLAMYIDKKIVDRVLAMDSWGHAFRLIRGPAEHFLKLRQDDYLMWPSLRAMFREAETYRYSNPPVQPVQADSHEQT